MSPDKSIRITKYANRRYYDATHSRHVTLDELYQAVLDGHTIEVHDSKTGDDLTNVVLMQVLLDRDPPKLELLPPALLHQVIRSNRPALRAFFDRYFGPMVTNYAAFQKQIETTLRQNAAANPLMAPAIDWAQSMMQMYTAAAAPTQPAGDGPNPAPPADEPNPGETIEQLHNQLTTLQNEVKRLRKQRKRPVPRKR